MAQQNYRNGPLSHLALPLKREYAVDHMQIMSSASVKRQYLNRQVLRPHNPFTAMVMPKLMPHVRMSHTMVVVQAAQELAYELGLNYEVVSAGGYGHDCGQICKGHFGEKWIAKKSGRDFRHEYFALVALRDLEGLKISSAVCEAIALHSFESGVMQRDDVSEESRVVAVGDKIAYVAVDTYEALEVLRLGEINLTDSTQKCQELRDELESLFANLYPKYQPINWSQVGIAGVESAYWSALHYLVAEAVKESAEVGRVSFSKSPTAKQFVEHRKILYRKYYSKVDDIEQDGRELEVTYGYLAEKFGEYPTLLLISLLNDIEVCNLIGALQSGNKNDLDDAQMSIVEAIYTFHLPKKDEREIDMFAVPGCVRCERGNCHDKSQTSSRRSTGCRD